ncbi:hypothetical protein [Limisalsivibrio acetivorans]|uniref:hypothetical protein n=1 Tax=Limisalsivibrio acetivorans TaxID=1304888 RepID=UPI0003B4A1E1|nr:hypothetical protein [Limisalsivibrio acetivorans]
MKAAEVPGNVLTAAAEERKAARIPALRELVFCDRVYRFPDVFPAEVIGRFVEMAYDEDVNSKEMDYLYFILVSLPKMAAEGETKYGNVFAEPGLSFGEYVGYQMERMKRLSGRGVTPVFCRRILELLWKFRDFE